MPSVVTVEGLIFLFSRLQRSYVGWLNSYTEQLWLHHLHALLSLFFAILLPFSAIIPSYINNLPLVTSAPLDLVLLNPYHGVSHTVPYAILSLYAVVDTITKSSWFGSSLKSVCPPLCYLFTKQLPVKFSHFAHLVKHFNRLPSDVVDVPSLETF